MRKAVIGFMLFVTLAWLAAFPVHADAANGLPTEPAYTLDKMVVLSRHNIRSPMSGTGSLLSDITPHTWFPWTSQPSELSDRGAVLETIMGQYFRQWLEKEGLFPENYQPEDGAVRFYANSKQRTIATSTFFSADQEPKSSFSISPNARGASSGTTVNEISVLNPSRPVTAPVLLMELPLLLIALPAIS